MNILIAVVLIIAAGVLLILSIKILQVALKVAVIAALIVAILLIINYLVIPLFGLRPVKLAMLEYWCADFWHMLKRIFTRL